MKYASFSIRTRRSARDTLTITGLPDSHAQQSPGADIRADVNRRQLRRRQTTAKLLSTMTTLTPEQFVMVVDSLLPGRGHLECNVISQAMTNETGGDESNTRPPGRGHQDVQCPAGNPTRSPNWSAPAQSLAGIT